MGEGEELWKRYCSFLDKPFSEQLEYNEGRLKDSFEKWKRTKMSRQLCPKGVKRFDEVPITTYNDYPILHQFGVQLESLSKSEPRRKGELWFDYYNRIGKKVVPMLDGWIPDEYGFCVKTSGTSGNNKWFAQTNGFSKNMESAISFLVMACSDAHGTTNVRKGDIFLNILSPVPYISGYIFRPVMQILRPVPPYEVADEISSMHKKIWMCLDLIKKGPKIDVVGGIASIFYMFSKFFTRPAEFYKEYYQSMNFGIKKLFLGLKYIQSEISGGKYKKASDILPVKGICLGGYDTRLYIDWIREEFGVEPCNCYGTTEFGVPMYGHPERKIEYFPDLRVMYFEFLTNTGEIKKIDELKKREVYGLVGTPFDSMLIRYDIADQFRVVDFRDDGMPIFDVEGRRDHVIDIYGYFRLTQTTAIKTLYEAGLKESDKWCVAKVKDPKEYLLFLMEKESEYPEKRAAKLIFDALQKVDPYFKNYVDDFKIKDPLEIIKVEYLKKGAFMRYTMKKVKEGAEIGNLKPPKIITANDLHTVDLLREV